MIVLTKDEQIVNNLEDLIYEHVNENDKQEVREIIRTYLPTVKDIMKKNDITPSDIIPVVKDLMKKINVSPYEIMNDERVKEDLRED